MSIPINIPEYFQKPAAAAQINFGDYIREAFTWSLVVLSIIAVVMLIIAGFQLMTSEIVGKKIDAKGRIKEILIGLLLAFSSVVILNTINPQLTTIQFFRSAATPHSTGVIDPNAGNGTGGTGPNGLPDPSTNNVRYVDAAGNVVIGEGKVNIDFDGSPGAYQVEVAPPGYEGKTYLINGVRYKSVGYESLQNAQSRETGAWVGVKTDRNGQPIIGANGYLQGVLSYQGEMNGDTTPFVALSSAQLAQARAARPGFKLGDTVILTANGNSVEAVYADNAGERDPNFSEVSPAAAKALGVPYGFNSKGVGWATGDVTISLPNR